MNFVEIWLKYVQHFNSKTIKEDESSFYFFYFLKRLCLDVFFLFFWYFFALYWEWQKTCNKDMRRNGGQCDQRIYSSAAKQTVFKVQSDFICSFWQIWFAVKDLEDMLEYNQPSVNTNGDKLKKCHQWTIFVEQFSLVRWNLLNTSKLCIILWVNNIQLFWKKLVSGQKLSVFFTGQHASSGFIGLKRNSQKTPHLGFHDKPCPSHLFCYKFAPFTSVLTLIFAISSQ